MRGVIQVESWSACRVCNDHLDGVDSLGWALGHQRDTGHEVFCSASVVMPPPDYRDEWR